jgi:hypothetical protein
VEWWTGLGRFWVGEGADAVFVHCAVSVLGQTCGAKGQTSCDCAGLCCTVVGGVSRVVGGRRRVCAGCSALSKKLSQRDTQPAAIRLGVRASL